MGVHPARCDSGTAKMRSIFQPHTKDFSSMKVLGVYKRFFRDPNGMARRRLCGSAPWDHRWLQDLDADRGVSVPIHDQRDSRFLADHGPKDLHRLLVGQSLREASGLDPGSA